MADQVLESISEAKGPEPGRAVACLCIDMIGSTRKTLSFATSKIDRFNRSLVLQIEPHLKALQLEAELLKFTGDGWLLITPHSQLIPQLCCLALIQKHCFQKEVATRANIPLDDVPPLRIALSQGRDIAVTLPDGRKDWVGDSARRATRDAQHCLVDMCEILIQDALVTASSLNRDFDLIHAAIEGRSGFEKHKREEPTALHTLQGIHVEAVADADASPFYVYTLNAIGDARAQATAERASEHILKEAAATLGAEPERVDRVLLPRLDLLVAAIPDRSFVRRMTGRRRHYGFKPSSVPYNIRIRDSSTFPQAVDWFERMRQDDIAPDVFTYSTLISKAEDYPTAKDWFERMRQDGVTPNVVTYSTLVSKAEDYATAKDWFARMRQDGVAPDVVTYNTLVGKAEDYATAKDWFERMRQDDVAPDVFTYSLLVSKAEDYTTARDWVERMRQDGVAPNVVTYNTLVSKAEDYTTAKDWFERMRQDGVTPNAVSMSALFARNLSRVPAGELLRWYWSLGLRLTAPLQAAIASYRKSGPREGAFHIALHYPNLQASEKLFRDFPAEAWAFLVTVSKTEPNHPDLEYARGVALMESGDNTEAEAHLRIAARTANNAKRRADLDKRLKSLREGH